MGIDPKRSLKNRFPEIAKQWHPTKNGDFKPEHFSYGSNKRAYWLCKKGHIYYSKIKERTGRDKTNCPYCFSQTSQPDIDTSVSDEGVTEQEDVSLEQVSEDENKESEVNSDDSETSNS